MRRAARPLLLAALLTAASGVPLLASASASAPCLPLMCKFSISGKKGPFLDTQVKAEKLAKADADMAAGLADGRALDASSLNRGAAAGTGLDMPLTEQALNRMLARIAAAWPHRAPMPSRVRIVGSTKYTAVAKPDGVIVVPLGLLMRARTDDEVAWVLAHEFSHVALAHFSREARQRKLKDGVDTIVGCARTGFELAQYRPDNSAGQLRFVRADDKKMATLSTQVWAKSQIVGTILEGYNKRLSRGQEDEADAAALDLVIRAGLSDAGFGTALETVEADEKRDESLLDAFGREMASYTQQAAAGTAVSLIQGQNAKEAGGSFLDGLLRNVLSIAGDKILKMVMTDHRPAKKRKEGLAKYLDQAYSTASPPEPQTAWLNAVRATAEFKDAQTAVQSHTDAIAALHTAPIDVNDPAQVAKVYASALDALAKIRPALGTRYARTPLIANALAQISIAVHDFSAADGHFDVANRSPEAPPPPPPRAAAKGKRGKKAPAAAAAAPVAPPRPPDPYLQQSLEGFRQHVDLLVRVRNWRKALSVVELAKSRFRDDEAFLPALVTIYAQTGQAEKLFDAVDRCQAAQDEAQSRACHYALLEPTQQEQMDKLPPADRGKVMSKLAVVTADARRGSACGLGKPQPAKPQT